MAGAGERLVGVQLALVQRAAAVRTAVGQRVELSAAAYQQNPETVRSRRGHGLGRALVEAAMDHARQRGATRIDLNTSVDDVAARALYESAGFTNREGGPEGPRMLYYERDL